MAIAPSLIGEELPAVTVPPFVKAGRRRPNDSIVLSGRIDSSRRTTWPDGVSTAIT